MGRLTSIEDKDLSVSSIVGIRSRVYKDIDLTFTPRPSGDIYKKQDAAAVKQSVKNIVMTNYYEKPFQPVFGADIRSLLFELMDTDTEEDIKNKIRSAIQVYEPRAKVVAVGAEATPDQNSINVTIIFRVINTDEEVTFTTVLARLR